MSLNNTPTTRPEIETLVGTIAKLTHQRDELAAELNGKLTTVKIQFEPRIQSLNLSIQSNTTIVEAWSKGNRSEFGDKQSIELLHGTLQFRNGPPKLEKLARTTWEKVLQGIKAAKKFGSDFVRSKESVDKDLILSKYKAKELDDKDLRAVGVYVDQEEFFSIGDLKNVPAIA